LQASSNRGFPRDCEYARRSARRSRRPLRAYLHRNENRVVSYFTSAGSLIDTLFEQCRVANLTIRAARRDGRSHALVSSFIRDFLICSD